MILAANDVADAQVGIVGAGGQVIGRHAVAAQQREVLDIGSGFRLLAVDRVGEMRQCRPRRAGRGSEARTARRRRRGGRFLRARARACPGLNSHVPCAPDFSVSPAAAGVKSRYARPFSKIASASCAVQREAVRLLVLLVPAEVEPAQPFEDGIERGLGVALDVGIVDAQDHGPAVVAGVEPVEDEGARAPDVQKARGRGRKANSEHGNCSIAMGGYCQDTR